MSEQTPETGTEPTERIAALVKPIADELGCLIHELTVRHVAREYRIAIVLDTEQGWEPGRGVTIEQTAHVARQLNYLLETDNVLGGEYTIEVSSPGIERALVTAEHFARHAGHDVHVVIKAEHGARAVYDGRLEGIEDGYVKVREADGTLSSIALGQIRKARTKFDFSVYDRQPKGGKRESTQKKPGQPGNKSRKRGEGTT